MVRDSALVRGQPVRVLARVSPNARFRLALSPRGEAGGVGAHALFDGNGL